MISKQFPVGRNVLSLLFRTQKPMRTQERVSESVKDEASGKRCLGAFGVEMIKFLIALTVLVIVFPGLVWSQKEVTSRSYRYREQKVSPRYYEGYEARPQANLPFVEVPTSRQELISLSPIAERVRRRKYLADAHQGLRFYKRLTCIKCHPGQIRSLHNARAKITCRQCHGPEPIAGINHYYSSMNPRRRYAQICAKCHEGASASFAKYVVHEPSPALMSTQKAFPLLFYVFWAMVAIAVGTFAAFLPHAFMWGVRELLPDTFRWNLRKFRSIGRKKDETN
ncbi:MAG: hypothetical protein P1P89_11055 [Desulfobacterales bacterium]|nr:hypothetical protein [Desulfobacterales bacterium]